VVVILEIIVKKSNYIFTNLQKSRYY
jgi:hypothetical protein